MSSQSRLHVGVGVNRVAAHDGRGDTAAQLPAIERRVLRSRPQLRGADSDLEIGREDRDVCRAARRQRSSGQCAGLRAGPVDKSSTSRGSRIRPGVHQSIERQRNGGLEPDDSERRAVELDLLLVVMMRCVVGGNRRPPCRRRFRPASRRDRPPRAAAGSSWCWCRTGSATPAPRRSA